MLMITQELYEISFEALKWAIICPIMGFILTIVFFGILETLELQFPSYRKTTCWLFFTLLSFACAAFLQVFA